MGVHCIGLNKNESTARQKSLERGTQEEKKKITSSFLDMDRLSINSYRFTQSCNYGTFFHDGTTGQCCHPAKSGYKKQYLCKSPQRALESASLAKRKIGWEPTGSISLIIIAHPIRSTGFAKSHQQKNKRFVYDANLRSSYLSLGN